jgi:predicted regulator of Ras-like GTPase activity (Roadblock/LC7/MglB family)
MDDQETKVNQNYNVVPFPQKKEETGEGFKGQFNNLKLSDLVQLSTQARMSLILHITQDGKQGKIYIHEGEIIHASSHKKTGVEAFYEIMSWKKGDFHSEAYIPPPIQSINLPWEYLLIESHRALDEKEAKLTTQPKSKILQLESISDKMIGDFRSWASSHPDIVEMDIFSSTGVRNIFQREDYLPPDESIEILHAISETSLYLGDALGLNTCEEIVVTGTNGTIIIYLLTEGIQLFVILSSEISKKAILKIELESFVERTKKQLKPGT